MNGRTRKLIDDFLRQKRIAIVGVSRNPRDFSRQLFREFAKRNYQVLPVNPAVTELEGCRCYSRVSEIAPPVDGILLMTAPDATATVLPDILRSGVKRIWIYRRPKAGFPTDRGPNVIEGCCPLMFFPQPSFFHRLHAFLMKLQGTYPTR